MKLFKSMSKTQFAFSLFLLTFFFSCQPDPSNTINPVVGTMTIEIDGVAHTPTSFNNTLLLLQQNGEAGRRLDLRANIGSDMLILSASNWDLQNPPTDGLLTKTYDTNTNGTIGPNQSCTTTSAGNLCDSGLGTYTLGGISNVSEAMSNEPTGAITISQNNTTDKTVSGTFDFKVKDFTQPNNAPKHITGSFSNLSYTVLN